MKPKDLNQIVLGVLEEVDPTFPHVILFFPAPVEQYNQQTYIIPGYPISPLALSLEDLNLVYNWGREMWLATVLENKFDPDVEEDKIQYNYEILSAHFPHLSVRAVGLFDIDCLIVLASYEEYDDKNESYASILQHRLNDALEVSQN